MTCKNCVFPEAIANGAGPAVGADQMENVARTMHHATIIPKSQFKRFRTHKHRFGTGVHVVWGVKPKSKAGPRGGVVYVHRLMFDRKRFSPRQAKQWLKAHGYTAKKFEAAVLAEKKRKAKKKRKARAANVLPENVIFQYAASMNPVEGLKTINKIATSMLKKAAEENPSLMVLMNPTVAANEKEVKLANKAYKSFHFKDSTKREKHKVPDNWPKTPYWILGVVDRFDAKDASGKTVSRTFKRSKPILASTKARKDVFIVSQNGNLKIPSGVGVRIDYTVPPGSGRTKWSRRWWHPHESSPKVQVHKGGKHVRITGPGLKITPRGIIG
jgi:hypothetical protein